MVSFFTPFTLYFGICFKMLSLREKVLYFHFKTNLSSYFDLFIAAYGAQVPSTFPRWPTDPDQIMFPKVFSLNYLCEFVLCHLELSLKKSNNGANFFLFIMRLKQHGLLVWASCFICLCAFAAFLNVTFWSARFWIMCVWMCQINLGFYIEQNISVICCMFVGWTVDFVETRYDYNLVHMGAHGTTVL